MLVGEPEVVGIFCVVVGLDERLSTSPVLPQAQDEKFYCRHHAIWERHSHERCFFQKVTWAQNGTRGVGVALWQVGEAGAFTQLESRGEKYGQWKCNWWRGCR